MILVETPQSNVLHQRLIGFPEKVHEPDGTDEERKEDEGSLDGGPKRQRAQHGKLEHEQANKYAVAYDGPGPASRVLAMVHGVKKLVFVNKGANDEVDESEKSD